MGYFGHSYTVHYPRVQYSIAHEGVSFAASVDRRTVLKNNGGLGSPKTGAKK